MAKKWLFCTGFGLYSGVYLIKKNVNKYNKVKNKTRTNF